MSYKKKDYAFMASKRMSAFMAIAKALGKDHEITKMMGGLAWGRSKAEQGPGATLAGTVREMAFLDGSFDILNMWARDNDNAAQRQMLSIYPRGWESAP